MEAINKKTKIEKIIKLTLLVVFGTLLITISAKVKIPFYPVPMTMQTFIILLLGITFGFKVGLAIVMLYLIEGIVGLPVFANPPYSGPLYLIGSSGGYLLGMLLASYVVGFYAERNYDKKSCLRESCSEPYKRNGFWGVFWLQIAKMRIFESLSPKR